MAWYMFIFWVSRAGGRADGGAGSSSSCQTMPGVRRAASRVVRRKRELATEGSEPPAGGGSVAASVSAE